MSASRIHCTVVEVDSDAHLFPVDAKDPPRDLLPWADPYISRLLTKYRLQAALEDSLRFVSDEAARDWGGMPPYGVARTPSDHRGRFTPCDLRRPLPPAALPPAGDDHRPQ